MFQWRVSRRDYYLCPGMTKSLIFGLKQNSWWPFQIFHHGLPGGHRLNQITGTMPTANNCCMLHFTVTLICYFNKFAGLGPGDWVFSLAMISVAFSQSSRDQMFIIWGLKLLF